MRDVWFGIKVPWAGPVGKTQEQRERTNEMHSILWPGWSIPCVTTSRFANKNKMAAGSSEDALQGTCLPTSLLISILVWAVSNAKRSSEDRFGSGKNFLKLLLRMAATLGNLKLRFPRIDSNEWSTVAVDLSFQVKHDQLWPTDPAKLSVLNSLWDAACQNDLSSVASNFQRPGLGEFILFALDPSILVPGIVPVAHCILTQLAAILDARIGEMANSVARQHFAWIRFCIVLLPLGVYVGPPISLSTLYFPNRFAHIQESYWNMMTGY